jgi:hypothetical protein
MTALFGLVLMLSLLVAGICGLIGQILLIIHAFQDDDVPSGVVMVVSFVFPILFLYTIYYMLTRWDGTAAFWLTLIGIIGALVYVFGMFGAAIALA